MAHRHGARRVTRAEEADRLRRTMGNMRKKGRLEAELATLRARMIGERESRPAHRRRRRRQIVSDLLSFANYGFPESHAWSFALIAYATAWLKAHHPTEFYLGLLNAQPMGFYPISTLIHDARRHGVEVRTPCLRDGDWLCTTEPSGDEARAAHRVAAHSRRRQEHGSSVCAARTRSRGSRPSRTW